VSCLAKGARLKIIKFFYKYSKSNSLSAFKKYVDKYLAKNEEPQDQPDPHLVQSVINTDDSRPNQRYDEKRMLTEFV
jgi:hypothetical protein